MKRHQHSKKFFLILFCLFITFNSANSQFKFTILHNNDGESKLINAGTGALANYGGVARFKTLLDSLRARSAAMGIPVIMLSSGDNFLAGPELQISLNLPYGTPFYDVVAMNSFDYDAICIGNHEFDFGPDLLARFIRGFSPLPQAPWLSSNLGFTGEDSLNQLALAGRIAPKTVLNIGGTSVGIIGATTPRLQYISSPGNVTIDSAIVAAIETQVTDLHSMGVNKIILISHLQSITEDTALCRRLTGVDVMIAGGGSEVLANPGDLLVPGDAIFGPYPLQIMNADNVIVPLITTEGNYKYIGKFVCEFDSSGNLVSFDTASGPYRVAGGALPDAVLPNTDLQNSVVTPVSDGLSTLANNIIAVSQDSLNGRRNDVRTKETNVGNLVADAILWRAKQGAVMSGLPVPQVAFQNGGGIRNNSVLPPGNFSELNTFSIVPFANFVSIVPNIPREQLKEILENAVSRVEAIDGRFAQTAGLYIKWFPGGIAQQVDNNGNVLVPGSRIVQVRLDDGSAGPGTTIVSNGSVIPGPPITVATIDFLARGGDQYPFRNAPFTILPDGQTYQKALKDYIQNELSGIIDSTMYPNRNTGRIVIIDQPLPVELSSFSSSVEGNNVTLNWSTSSELNNSGFEIERALKNGEWVKTGFVNGNGTVNEPKYYSFMDKNLNTGIYNYRLKQIDFNGNYEYHNLSNDVLIGVPEEYSLSQNYPNPFNPSTMINFDLPQEGKVKLIVSDFLGREILQLVNNELKPAGRHLVEFNGNNLSSGVYFYRLEVNDFVQSRRMILIK